MRSLLGGMMLSALVVCCSAHAMSLNDLVIGTRESGPNLSPKDLKGKVVFVVYWGTH